MAPRTPPAFQVMLKPRGPICNLDCQYCYYSSSEQLYPGSSFRISDDLLEAFTRQYIEGQRVPEVTFAWQGGEPTLMGLEFFRRAVAFQQKYRRPDMRIQNALQTNGTLLTEDWCVFFRENDFLVGISMDGPADLHDRYRVDKGGQPSFDRVRSGVELLKKHGVKFNVLTCVHAGNSGQPLVVYRFLRDEIGARFIQFIPVVERDDSTATGATAASVTGATYGEFLNAVFDEWVHRDVGQVFVQLFDVALAVWTGNRPGLCVFENTCGAALVMEHNGDIYACDHFVEPSHLIGNINVVPLTSLVGSTQQGQFGRTKQASLPDCCLSCRVRFVCNGGCPKDRFLFSPEGQPGLNYLCEGYRAFFQHIDRPIRIMARAIAEGRSPAHVMFTLAHEQAGSQQRLARVGRNEPCPCGSGRKAKHCCKARAMK